MSHLNIVLEVQLAYYILGLILFFIFNHILLDL